MTDYRGFIVWRLGKWNLLRPNQQTVVVVMVVVDRVLLVVVDTV